MQQHSDKSLKNFARMNVRETFSGFIENIGEMSKLELNGQSDNFNKAMESLELKLAAIQKDFDKSHRGISDAQIIAKHLADGEIVGSLENLRNEFQEVRPASDGGRERFARGGFISKLKAAEGVYAILEEKVNKESGVKSFEGNSASHTIGG